MTTQTRALLAASTSSAISGAVKGHRFALIAHIHVGLQERGVAIDPAGEARQEHLGENRQANPLLPGLVNPAGGSASYRPPASYTFSPATQVDSTRLFQMSASGTSK